MLKFVDCFELNDMLKADRHEKILSAVMNLFDPLQIEDSPNYPIADAKDRLNEPLIYQIEIQIQQAIAILPNTPTRFFENNTQLTSLITSSGGHRKSLYRLIHDTASYTETLPVHKRAIVKARFDLRYVLHNSVGEYQWDLLAKTHKDPYCAYSQIEQYEPLLKWSILKYGQDGIEWYRVHPLLVETQRFRVAIENFR